jgi:hypothetical protein
VTAVFSHCGRYRYRLERDLGVIGATHGAVAFIMLNPSTADATADDPTIRRCIGYARAWGHARLLVGNAYAWRSTDPAGLWTADPDPVGPDNDQHIEQIARDAELVVCAWGANIKPDRADAVRRAIERADRQPHALAFTAAGQPRHPLYLRGDLLAQPWNT